MLGDLGITNVDINRNNTFKNAVDGGELGCYLLRLEMRVGMLTTMAPPCLLGASSSKHVYGER